MAEWSIQCKVCGRVFTVPEKRPPEVARERVILEMAVPRHATPGERDKLCPGSAKPGERQKRLS
jgi:hypothetical protein